MMLLGVFGLKTTKVSIGTSIESDQMSNNSVKIYKNMTKSNKSNRSLLKFEV